MGLGLGVNAMMLVWMMNSPYYFMFDSYKSCVEEMNRMTAMMKAQADAYPKQWVIICKKGFEV